MSDKPGFKKECWGGVDVYVNDKCKFEETPPKSEDRPGGGLAVPTPSSLLTPMRPVEMVYAELEPEEMGVARFPWGWMFFLLILLTVLIGEILGAFDPEIAYLASLI